MISERAHQNHSSTKYYQFYTFTTILEHVIDCLHTMLSDENNPYHPPIAWLTRKQLKPPDDELFHGLFLECMKKWPRDDDQDLSAAVRNKLERYTVEQRRAIVNKTREECSPLFMACVAGRINIVRYLIETCGADIEQTGQYEAIEDHRIHLVTPLWVAAVTGKLDIVKLLIEKGANVNALSDSGSTPLRSASFLCKDDELRTPEQDINEDEAQSDPYIDIVKLLVENGADLSISNYNGGTCLINAIHNYALTKYLIDQGIDVNASDNQSKTALHYAIQKGRLDVVKLLISRGADHTLKANSRDDALQLSCIYGHVDISEYLVDRFEYPESRLADAYRLLGSSMLELQYDSAETRRLWQKSLCFQLQHGLFQDPRKISNWTDGTCDTRRTRAFYDCVEFSSEIELNSLTDDDFRLQSLLISERVLGDNYREMIQRLLYQGTFYFNSMRPSRCIDLWIYALQLRLEHENIFHLESILAAQAITKLFQDLFCQEYPVSQRDLYDVAALLVDQLDFCEQHLRERPVYSLHEDIQNLLINIIMNLLYALDGVIEKDPLLTSLTDKIICKLVEKDPRTSDGSSLLHLCIADLTASDTNRLLASKNAKMTPVVELIHGLIRHNVDVDTTNRKGVTPLQALCLANTGEFDKRGLVKLLVANGAHVDRRSSTAIRYEAIRHCLVDAGVKPLDHITLACLAARQVARSKIKFDENLLTKCLKETVAIH